jgi:magnesium chelatase family protein
VRFDIYRPCLHWATSPGTQPLCWIRVSYMNPCLCGFYGDSARECRCTPGIIQRYLGKISGPLLDRIDIHIEVPRSRL